MQEMAYRITMTRRTGARLSLGIEEGSPPLFGSVLNAGIGQETVWYEIVGFSRCAEDGRALDVLQAIEV